MGGDPQVIGTDRPANSAQFSTKLSVFPRYRYINIDNLNSREQVVQAGAIFLDTS